MKNAKKLLAILVAVAAITLVGCARQAPPQIEETPPPPPPPPQVWEEPDTTAFVPVDLDAELNRQIAAYLQPVFFSLDRHYLRRESIDKIQRAAEFLNRNPQLRVRLDGHTDDRGTTEHNLALGERRALEVRDALVRFGVNRNRLETTSFGLEMPARLNCGRDEDCHQANRRTEYTVIAR